MEVGALEDVLYRVDRGLAWITINRPHRYNAFRNRTIDELRACLKSAWDDHSVGVVALIGTGDRAFCSGHDQKESETDPHLREIDQLHRLVCDIPKPVIAAVNGVAAGGGHVLHVLCDISIASDTARFGQVGPRVGSFDLSDGAAYLAQVVGQKRAREIWFLCELYDAATAERWGLVNKVVPQAELIPETRRWADKLLVKSPTALRFLKHAFSAASERNLGHLSSAAWELYRDTEEAQEGTRAFLEKRDPDYSHWR